MLELRALGNAEIQTDKATLRPSQEIVFASALYLILEKGKKVSRTGLAELLWPSVAESARGHRLRQTLLQLKKLGIPLVADNTHLLVSPEQVVTDVDHIESGGSESFTNYGSLEFMPGYSPCFSEPFRDWLDGKRSEVNSNCSRALIGMLRHKRARANWAGVEELARIVLKLDPLNESAVLALAEASAMRGQKREAVTMLDRYVQEMGSNNADLRLPASVLRKRMLDIPLPAPPRPIGDPLFVGRETEMELLTSTLRKAQKARGGACLLVGEPGIGKSRLASELAKFAELQGVHTQSVSCQRANVDRPLSVLVDLVPLLREMPGAIGCSQETLTVLRRLTEFDTRGVESSASTGESHALQRAIRHALFDLLDALTDEACLVLVFDDIQWIDRASADILAAMIAWAKSKRLLFVFNSRKDGTDLLERLVRADMETLELNALTDDSAGALLRSVVGDQIPQLGRDMSCWILTAGEGNPFFLQELAKHWLESGDCAEGPASIGKVLRGRLSRLNSVSLKVLQACTILGQSSTVERVEGVLEYSPHELLGAIQELSTAGMLICPEESSGLVPLTLHTRHDLLAGAVLECMSAPSRAFLHRRAGLVLERELSGERMPTALLWACAFHWHHAGDRDRALAVARSCAEHLLEVGLPRDATDALERALDYCGNEEQRISLLARQVDALQMDGQWERSKQVLQVCRQLRARTTPSANQHDAFEIMLFDASYRSSLNVLDLLPEAISCVECADAAPEHRIQAGVIALKAATDVDPLIMDSVYRQVQPLFSLVEVDDANRIEAELVYHSVRGDGNRGMAAGRALVQFARQSKDSNRLARALMNAANSCRINGSVSESEECLYEAIDCNLKHHLIERAAMAMYAVVRLRMSINEIALAREMFERSKALPIAAENVVASTEQQVLEARLALKEGNLAGAAREFFRIQDASLAYSPSRRAAYLALEIQIRALRGDTPDVLRPLVEKLEAAHSKVWAMGMQDFEAESLYLGLRAIGEEDRGVRLLNDYLRNHRREKRPCPQHITELATQGRMMMARVS